MKRIIMFIVTRKKFITFSLLRLLSMVLLLVSNIFIVRKLSIEEFGIFSIALMVVNLVLTFGFSWSSSSILYYGSKEKELYGNINKTFWSRNIIIVVSLIIVTIAVIVFRKDINNFIGLDIWYLLLLWLYVSVLEDYLNQYFLAVKKQIISTILSVTAKVIYILLIIFIPFDITTLITLYIVSHASVILYILFINKKDIGKFEFDKPWFKEVLSFSFWQLFGFAGLYLLNFGDIAVIKYFMTTEDIGIYNAAFQLFSGVAGFAFVISSYYASSVSSYFVRNDNNSIKKFFYRERFYLLGASIIGHIILMIFSENIIILLYGQKYSDSVIIFNILLIGSMIRYASVFYMIYYNTNRKYRLQQTLNILQAIANIVLNIMLIPIFGLLGAAIGTILALVFKLIFSIFYCEKRIIKGLKVTD